MERERKVRVITRTITGVSGAITTRLTTGVVSFFIPTYIMEFLDPFMFCFDTSSGKTTIIRRRVIPGYEEIFLEVLLDAMIMERGYERALEKVNMLRKDLRHL